MAKKVTKKESDEAEVKATAKKTGDKKEVKPKSSPVKDNVKVMEKSADSLESTAKKSSGTKKKAETTVNEVISAPDVKKVEKPAESVAAPSGAPIRYSDEDLDMFAGVINEAKTEALEELRMLKERLEDLTSFDAGEESMIYSMHMAEQGSEAQEKEKTYAQIQRISEHIKKLDDAMDRIRNKTYGICRVCGCLIAKERLLAVPITTLSAAYKIHSKCPDDGIDKIEPVKI